MVTLFDKDDNFGDKQADWQPYLKQLRAMKRRLPLRGDYRLRCDGGVIVGSYVTPDKQVWGVFPVSGAECTVAVDLPDGLYRDMIDGREVEVRNGKIHTDGTPVVMEKEAAE